MGIIVAGVGLTKRPKRSAIIASVLLAISMATAYVVLNKYTDIANKPDATADQQDAIYRRELFTTYRPLIAIGGVWGWGYPIPDLSTYAEAGSLYTSQKQSIDNEYLRIGLAQGYFGLAVYVLSILSTMWVLLRHSFTFRNRVDIMFSFALLGAVIATAFSLSTVYMGLPIMQILFLVMGWAQALQPTVQSQAKPDQIEASSKFAFDKVFA